MNYNDTPLDAFDGLTPRQMHVLITQPWDTASFIKFNKITDADFEACPIFRQVYGFLAILKEQGKIKLTSTGALPVKWVKHLYALGLPDKLIEEGISKITREDYCPSARRSRLVASFAGLVKVKSGSLELTRKGERLFLDKQALLKSTIETFSTQINFAYFDGFTSEEIALVAPMYGLILLSRYGHIYRPTKFYADMYFTAFPELRDNYPRHPFDDEHVAEHCYTVRYIMRFLDELGFIEWLDKNKHPSWSSSIKFKASPFFHQALRIEVPCPSSCSTT